MAEPGAQARIEDLKRRLDRDPGSRLFVALAEEYRKSGRLAEALSTLQKGLLAHPNYLSAQVALGRAYLESGQITEAVATFSKVLIADPGNLVSAKSLADIYLSRGEGVEAVKKYKLYKALSGDRGVDEVIAHLEKEIAPPPPPAIPRPEAAPPPPPTFAAKPSGPIRQSRAIPATAGVAATDALEITSVTFEKLDETGPTPGEALAIPSRDLPVPASSSLLPASAPPPRSADPEADVATRALRVSELRADERPPSSASPEPTGPQGRTLADLYYAQGHYAEALRIYDDLVATHPYDDELRRLRRDSEARLLPAAATAPGAAAPDPALERRLARIRVLRRWLSVLQAG